MVIPVFFNLGYVFTCLSVWKIQALKYQNSPLKRRKTEWMERIKSFGRKWALTGECKGGISFFLWGFSLPNTCFLRKIREWIKPYHLSIPSGSSIQSKTQPFGPTFLSHKSTHIPAEKHKTSGDIPSIEIPRKKKNTQWLSFHPTEMRERDLSCLLFYF